MRLSLIHIYIYPFRSVTTAAPTAMPAALPSCAIVKSRSTGTCLLYTSELHLEIIVDRLLREFKVEANVGAPQVAYKETITKAVDQDTKYARQSGGKGCLLYTSRCV